MTLPPRKPQRVYTGLVGLPPEPADVTLTTSNPTLKGTVDEEAVRQAWAVSEPEKKSKIPGSYRQLLHLDPQDIIDFFDVQVGETAEFTQVDFVVPRTMLEHRIKRLQKIIAHSKQIIEQLSVRVMKIRRGEDNVLDKPTREKFKREENARIARSNAKLFRYQTGLRLGIYTEKISGWITKPLYFRDVIDDTMIFTIWVGDAKYVEGKAVRTGGLHTHNTTDLVLPTKRDFFNLERYKTVLKLNEEALNELGETHEDQTETWRTLTQWENLVIRAAVHEGIIIPRRDLAELLGLGNILDDQDDIPDDWTENKIALKTGGACYGGRIRGEYRYRGGKFTPRALTGFDKPLQTIKPEDPSEFDPGMGDLRDFGNDDVESFVPK